MAKYGRYDPRNKKNGKHKSQSLNKDFKIKEVDNQKRFSGRLLQEVVYDDEHDYDEPQQLNS